MKTYKVIVIILNTTLYFSNLTAGSTLESFINNVTKIIEPIATKFDEHKVLNKNFTHRFKNYNKETIYQSPYLTNNFQKQLDKASNSKLTFNNNLKLLKNSESFKEKLSLLEKAEQSIFISTYQFRCDNSGKTFMQKLNEALTLKPHLQASIVIDGSKESILFNPPLGGIEPCKSILSEENAKRVRFYKTPLLGGRELHEKLFIIDGTHAIVGGQNMTDWWADSDGQDNNFRDTDVYVNGPVVISIAQRALDIVRRLNPQDNLIVQLNKTIGLKDKFKHLGLIGSKNTEAFINSHGLKGICRFIVQEEGFSGSHHIIKAYDQLAQAATHNIIFHVPNIAILPSQKEKTAFWATLNSAAKNRNVEVSFIVNTIGYNKARMVDESVPASFLVSSVKEILKCGVFQWGGFLKDLYDTIHGSSINNVFIYRSWIHSKVFFFDNLAASIGSLNLNDETSSEATLLCIDEKLNNQLQEMFTHDIEYSLKIPSSFYD